MQVPEGAGFCSYSCLQLLYEIRRYNARDFLFGRYMNAGIRRVFCTNLPGSEQLYILKGVYL